MYSMDELGAEFNVITSIQVVISFITIVTKVVISTMLLMFQEIQNQNDEIV